jgi:hypothetical protein
MFGKKDPLSRSEVKKTLRLKEQSFGAFARGDIALAMQLDDQLEARHNLSEAEYRRRYGRGIRDETWECCQGNPAVQDPPEGKGSPS